MGLTKKLDRVVDRAADAAVKHKMVGVLEGIWALCVTGLWLCVAFAAYYILVGGW